MDETKRSEKGTESAPHDTAAEAAPGEATAEESASTAAVTTDSAPGEATAEESASSVAVTTDSAPGATAASPKGRSSLRRFLLMEDRIAAAEQQAHGGSRRRQEAFRRATAAIEAADVVLANSRRETGQEDVASAAVLFRDALRWAIVATGRPLEAGASAAEAWAQLDADPEAAGLERLSKTEREATRRAFVDRAALEAPEASHEDLCTDLAALRGGVDAVLALPYREARAVARLRIVRRLRWAAVALLPVVIGASILTWRYVEFRRQNVALRKPTFASSLEDPGATAAGAVDGKTVGVGFQTRREHHPWLKIDLVETRRIHRITVYNADHCCFERAVPLVIEVSTDGKKYQQVARRDRPFGIWKVNIGPVEARFVRLTVDKTTIFHLSEVEIR
jgi:hypothetical protein